MSSQPFAIPVQAAAALLGGPGWPQVVDLRLEDDFQADPHDIPGSLHREESAYESWRDELDRERPVILSCHHGLKISQAIAARLRADGRKAAILTGGFVAWREAGLPLVDRLALAAAGWREGASWVTRRRPKIDRAACPWLISRFLDPSAQFLFVEPDQVQAVAARTGGIAYDIPDVTVTHRGGDCSFVTLIGIAGLQTLEPLMRVASIVRGADNARLDLAPEAAGLLAVSLGLSDLAGDDDHGMLRHAFVVYDALYAWAARRAGETHNWPPKA
ncbi:MAG: chromate resistance protein [Methylocystis sp.]|nr:chromate resistance protein [Methylocystis sp.]MCA3583660.1 chromate resistance protein [Methylocystis sp.]MCA3587860.1 chromate resistance protein [Methylocystis sp.]MCA3593142.1 chromate resistance protein [Methylocystis sp.]